MGHAAPMGKKRYAQKILVGKPERERLLERSRGRWQENKVVVSDTAKRMEWIYLAYDGDK